MKNLLIIATLLFIFNLGANAQIGDMLKRKAGEGAANATENAINKGVTNVFKKKDKTNNNSNTSKPNAEKSTEANNTETDKNASSTENASLKTYSKYDFVPGEKIVAYADFSQDEIGDFANHWNTNSSGEIMTVDGKPGKWLSIGKEGFYIPMFINSLPENFTLEYDVIFIPLPELKGANTASSGFQLVSMDMKKQAFDLGVTRAQFEIDPYMATFDYESYTKDGNKILASSNNVEGLERHHNHFYHVSVWRQNIRVRVYLDQNKVCDLPMVLSETGNYNAIRFHTDMNNDGSNWLISNIKLAVGAPDTRSKLMTEGKFSTTGILFDVNSSTIKPGSYGTLKQIAQVLKDNPNVKIKIVGHTDSDGNDAANLLLSKQRAEAVKASLTKEFGIDESLMQTDGKGASQPVSANTTPEGKAQNRRVEFIKM